MTKLKIQIISALLFFALCPAFAQNEPTLFRLTDEAKMTQWVDSVFDTMTLDEKIGQLFMITISPAAAYHDNGLRHIANQKTGGILFSKGTTDEEAASINLYQKNSRIPLLIAFDGEWGLSMRLENTPRFPKNMMLGAISDTSLIYLYGEEAGRECREMGIHINFAPVIDVNCNPQNPVIGTRSFGENPETVAALAIAYSRGIESKGVMAVGKHFPGHGDTAEDSHLTLPSVNKTAAELDNIELAPFKQFINAGFGGIMTGHLNIPALDSISGKPTSLSPITVKELLQNRLGFNGLAFTDALAMKGASITGQSICVDALKAGNDVLLNPTNPAEEFAAVKKAVNTGEIPLSLIEEKCIKILKYKYVLGLQNQQPVVRKGLSQRLNTEHSRWLVQKLNNEAITLLKNENEVLPLKNLDKNKIAVLSISADVNPQFQKTLAIYNKFAFFRFSPSSPNSEKEKIFAELKHYDVIVCAVHSTKQKDLTALQNLAKTKNVHLCFFTTPYHLAHFAGSIKSAKSVVLCYEDTPAAQKAGAEAIMGGIPMRGQLPVTIKGLFELGAGLKTEKTRLSYQSPIEEKMSADTLQEIETIVREGIENKAFPGCQILIAKNGTVVYSRSFGHFDYAGTHNVENEDIYDLASLTKTLATLPAVMKLYDQKKISLSDPVSRYVHYLKNSDKEDITVRQCLFHESRLAAFLSFYQSLIDRESYEGKLFSSSRSLTHSVLFDTKTYARTDFRFIDSLVSQNKKKGFETEVAEKFFINDNFKLKIEEEIVNSALNKRSGYLYSDLNFILLRETAEKITGVALDRYVDSLFYRKLGAYRTTYRPLQKFDRTVIAPTENDRFWRNQILIGYPHDEAAAVMGGVSGNAGLFSDADDIAKILQMFLWRGRYGDEALLSEATVKFFTGTKSAKSRRGLGFDKPDMDKPERTPACSLSPASTYGHTGYTGTCFWVDPDSQLIYIFLSNRVYPSRTNKELISRNIRGRILEVAYRAVIDKKTN